MSQEPRYEPTRLEICLDLSSRLEAHLVGLVEAGRYTSRELEMALDGARVALQERRIARRQHDEAG